MTHSTSMIAYFVWAAAVVGGALLALADWRWIRRPWLCLLLVIGLVGGYVTTMVSPFDFVTGGYYMQGALVSAGSALALIGYVLATVWHFASRRFAGRRPP